MIKGMENPSNKRLGPIGWFMSRRRRYWVIAALVCYPLSTGPAVLISSALGSPQWFDALLKFIYYPVGFVITNPHTPIFVARGIVEWIEWWNDLL